MKLAIMQPYFFPYIGYFQLMHLSALVFLISGLLSLLGMSWRRLTQ